MNLNAKNIIRAWLLDHGYDGLYNPLVPCACLCSDLAPCEGMSETDCRAGYKAWVGFDPNDDTPCDCDNRECIHWHIQDERPNVTQDHYNRFIMHLEDARNWRCDCGERGNPSSGNWRWNGRAWEHNHGGQGGHFEAKRAEVKA